MRNNSRKIYFGFLKNIKKVENIKNNEDIIIKLEIIAITLEKIYYYKIYNYCASKHDC